MSIGGGIALIVLGAVLAFGLTETQVAGFKLQTIGYICMLAGLAGIILGFVLQGTRRRSSRVVTQESYGPGGQTVLHEERQDPMPPL